MERKLGTPVLMTAALAGPLAASALMAAMRDVLTNDNAA